MLNETEKQEVLTIIKNLEDDYLSLKTKASNGYFNKYNSEDLVEYLLDELVYHKRESIRSKVFQIAMNIKTNDFYASHFKRLIKSKFGGHRNVALHGLIQHDGDLRATDDLIQIAKFDKVTPNRTAAIEALGLYADESAIEALDKIIELDHYDDGNGHTPSSMAEWAKREIENKFK
jgi:HEAT repeat protein